MSKIYKKLITLESSFFIETKFLSLFFNKETGEKTKSSFNLLFQIGEIISDESDGIVVDSSELSAFFVQTVLDRIILNYHTPDTNYYRVQFRIASDSKQILNSFKFEIPIKRGTGARLNEDMNQIFGNYSCRFIKENQRNQLTLRIKNIIAPPQMDYFINSFLNTSFEYVISGNKKINFKFVGLTLNRAYPEIYDFFDEILEKIQ